MTNKQYMPVDTDQRQGTINIGELQLPQKVYPWRGFEKAVLLLSMLLALFLLVPFIVAGLIPSGMAVSVRVSFVMVAAVSIVILGGVFFRAWSQRLEFSADGVTLSYFFPSEQKRRLEGGDILKKQDERLKQEEGP